MGSAVATSVRAVTDDEVEFFTENGWVHLPRLIDPDLDTLLPRGRFSMMTSSTPTSFSADRLFWG